MRNDTMRPNAVTWADLLWRDLPGYYAVHEEEIQEAESKRDPPPPEWFRAVRGRLYWLRSGGTPNPNP